MEGNDPIKDRKGGKEGSMKVENGEAEEYYANGSTLKHSTAQRARSSLWLAL